MLTKAITGDALRILPLLTGPPRACGAVRSRVESLAQVTQLDLELRRRYRVATEWPVAPIAD